MKTSRRREARKLADYPVVSISETMFFLGKLNAYYSVIKKMDSISYVYITWTILRQAVGDGVSISVKRQAYSEVQKDGLSFVLLYFLSYTRYVDDLHNIWKRRS